MLYQQNMLGAPLTEQEKELLAQAQGGLEFEKVKESIRVSRGGSLPPNWFDEVIGSGFIANKIAAWISEKNQTITDIEWMPYVHQGYME